MPQDSDIELAKLSGSGSTADAGRDLNAADGAIPARYRGTEADRKDMWALGRRQQLRRNYGIPAMFAFANSVMVMWETFLAVSYLGLSVGGRAPVFWGLIYGALAMACVYMTIAEMVSIAPTASGQYQWVSELAPPRVQKYMSYITGGLSTREKRAVPVADHRYQLVSLGWVSYLTLVSNIAAGVIQGEVLLNYPDYVPQPWHTTLIAWAIVAFSFFFNTVVAPRLPQVQVVFFILHLLGWIAVIMTLLILSPRTPVRETFTVFSDNAEWGGAGLAAMITMSNSVGLFIGYESPVHLCEELEDASANMPCVIRQSVIWNVVMTVVLAGIYLTAIGDLDTVLSTPTGMPFIQVFLDATKSKVGTNCLASLVIVQMISACISEGACASRQIWSFARDGGFPGSSRLSKVSVQSNVPVNAVMATAVLVCAISLINIGSSAALNAINSLGGISILATYLTVVGYYIWNRLHNAKPPRGDWSRYGLIFAVLGWTMVLPVFLFLLWPLENHPDAVTMNWAVAMCGGVAVLATVWYVVAGSKSYTPPVSKVQHTD